MILISLHTYLESILIVKWKDIILIEKTVTILCSLEVGSLEPKNEPSFNFQYFDPQFARTGLYIYVHIVPIGYIYVVILLHKKDNWANKSCIYSYFNLHIAMQKFAFGSL